MQGNSITQVIDEHTVFEHLDINQTVLWGLMLLSGYLTAEDLQLLIDSTFSFRDIDKKNGERFYHGVMLVQALGIAMN